MWFYSLFSLSLLRNHPMFHQTISPQHISHTHTGCQLVESATCLMTCFSLPSPWYERKWYICNHINHSLSYSLLSSSLSSLSFEISLPLAMSGSPVSCLSPITHYLLFYVIIMYCEDVIKEQLDFLSLSLSVSYFVWKKCFREHYLYNDDSQ